MREEAKRLRSLADTYDTAGTRSQLIALGAGVDGFIGTCICPGPGTAAGALGLTSLIGYITYEQGESEDECIERAEALEDDVERLQGLASVWERGYVGDPYCGDGSCTGDETRDTCPEDCGECPPETPAPTETLVPTEPPDECGCKNDPEVQELLSALEAGKNKINENKEEIAKLKLDLTSLMEDLPDTLDNREHYLPTGVLDALKKGGGYIGVYYFLKEGVKHGAQKLAPLILIGQTLYAIGNEIHLHGQIKSIENIPSTIEYYKIENRDLQRQINDITNRIKSICPCTV